ncbi:MAG: transposase [Nitrospira sp.]|nr:transposase [Nitrospira sp.]
MLSRLRRSIPRLRVLASASGLRLHCLQQWFNLSDQAAAEALYDSRALRQFVSIDLGLDPQNRRKEWDPEMHQTKRGTQWYFVIKAHLGVDSQTKLIHAVAATAATAHDSQGSSDLLYGQETRVWGLMRPTAGGTT